MPFGWAGAAASAIGAVGSLVKGSGQSGDISAGQAQAHADLQPFVNTGTLANTQEANLFGLNGTDAATTAMGQFTASPGYQYDVTQGLKAVDSGAAANGMLRSGATLKAEQTFGTNLANQDFQQYIGNLNGLTKLGQASAAGDAATDTSAAGQQASIYGNAIGGATNAIGTALTNPGVQNSLTSLFSSGSGVESGSWD
jgi:hypothetical protein